MRYLHQGSRRCIESLRDNFKRRDYWKLFRTWFSQQSNRNNGTCLYNQVQESETGSCEPAIRIPTERSLCKIETEIEGCLSFPDRKVAVPRYSQVIVKADNYGGEIQFSGLWARIIQHEVEHLDGRGIWGNLIIGRHDPCPCGSGKKHKKCCGARK